MSPAANDLDAMHRANERAYGSQAFTYTPPAGDPVAGLIGDYRDEPEAVEAGGDAQAEVRSGGLRIGARTAQLPAGVEFEIDGAVTFPDGPAFPGGASFRVIDVLPTAGHAWVYLHRA